MSSFLVYIQDRLIYLLYLIFFVYDALIFLNVFFNLVQLVSHIFLFLKLISQLICYSLLLICNTTIICNVQEIGKDSILFIF